MSLPFWCAVVDYCSFLGIEELSYTDRSTEDLNLRGGNSTNVGHGTLESSGMTYGCGSYFISIFLVFLQL